MPMMPRIVVPFAALLIWFMGLSMPGCNHGTQRVIGDDPASTDSSPLRVMSFNIRYGTADDGDNHWRLRDHLVRAVIEDHQPDIIGLQEALAFQLDELADALPQYAHIGVGRSDGKRAGEFCAILYRRDLFEVVDHGTFWLSETPDVVASKSWGNRIERICTWARLKSASSPFNEFYVFNVHFDHQSQPSRERSAQLLVERIATRESSDIPFILTGDFNAGPDNPAIITLREATGSAKMIDCYRAANPVRADSEGTFNAFRGEINGDRIDYIFCSPNVDVRRCIIVHDNDEGQYPSDHFPILAELQSTKP